MPRYAEPIAESQNWWRSSCPYCLHREFAFIFLNRTVASARADGLWGIMVVPFATDDQTWTTLAAASLISVQGRKDRWLFREPILRATLWRDPESKKRLAVLAVDFSRCSGRQFESIAPACPRETQLPPRPSFQHGRERQTPHRDCHAPCRPAGQ